MRIALYGHDALGVRIARVLLAERGLDRLGIVGERIRHPRVEQVDEVGAYDAIILDRLDDTGWELLDEAIEERTDVILVDATPDIDPPLSAVIADAANPRYLAHALARSARAEGASVEVEIAWTVPGRPRRSGEPVTFPEPVGPRWASREEVREPGVHRALAAPGPGPWQAALAKVTTMADAALRTTISAVVDDADFLKALMVAATAVAAAEGAYSSGIVVPADPDGAYMRALTRSGLETATFTRT